MAEKTSRGIKSTIEFPEELWKAAKHRATDERKDFRSVVIEALEKHLGVKVKKGGRDAR